MTRATLSLRGVSLALLGIALPLGACGPPADQVERLGQARSAIVGGSASGPAQDAVVMLVFSDPANNQRSICTAVLLAPRLVLTARHCVSFTDVDVTCGIDGVATDGGVVRSNHPAGQLYVFTGPNRPDLDPTTWKPAGRGLEVLDDGSKNLCNHDLALVLLEQPVGAALIAPIRLDGDATGGERLTTVGWGVTSDVLEPDVRQQRAGVTVTRVGPDMMSPVLTPNEFSFDESICLGDSGGPIFSEASGAVVGVVSRGGNGTSSSNLASTCTKAVNLGTKLSPFRDLVMRGFAAASATPRLEERPAAKEDEGCNASGRRPGWVETLAGLAGLALLFNRRGRDTSRSRRSTR